MIPRYSRPDMAAIWTEEAKLQLWLEVELLACEGHHKLGHIPKADLDRIWKRAKFSLARTQEIEAEVHHDVIAFLTDVAEHVGPVRDKGLYRLQSMGPCPGGVEARRGLTGDGCSKRGNHPRR